MAAIGIGHDRALPVFANGRDGVADEIYVGVHNANNLNVAINHLLAGLIKAQFRVYVIDKFTVIIAFATHAHPHR